MQYGSLLAKQFDVPQQRQQSAATGKAGRPAGGGGPADFKFDDYGLKPFDGLDRSNPDVAQAAQQYYQDWAALRSFAKTMWVKYGVDVMSPDPGDENAIWANQAFNQKLALLMNNVDRAKNDFDVWKADQAAQREGKMIGKDYMGSASTMGLMDRGTPIFPESPATANLMKGAQNITPGQAAAANVDITNQVAQYENLAQQAQAQGNRQLAEYYRQQAAIAQPLKVVAAENTPRSEYGSGLDTPTGIIMKELALYSVGSPEIFDFSAPPKYGVNGNLVYTAKPGGTVGKVLGQKATGDKGPYVIAGVEYEPDRTGGKSYFVDKTGERKEITTRNLAIIGSEFVKSGVFNRKDLIDTMKAVGADDSNASAYKFFSLPELQALSTNQQTQQQTAEKEAPRVRQAFDYFMSQVDLTNKKTRQTVPTPFGSIPLWETRVLDKATIPLTNGQEAVIKPIDGEVGVFRIDNFADIFPKGTQKDTYQVGDEIVTKTELTRISKNRLFELLNKQFGIDISKAPQNDGNQATPAQPSNPWSQYKKQTP